MDCSWEILLPCDYGAEHFDRKPWQQPKVICQPDIILMKGIREFTKQTVTIILCFTTLFFVYYPVTQINLVRMYNIKLLDLLRGGACCAKHCHCNVSKVSSQFTNWPINLSFKSTMHLFVLLNISYLVKYWRYKCNCKTNEPLKFYINDNVHMLAYTHTHTHTHTDVTVC